MKYGYEFYKQVFLRIREYLSTVFMRFPMANYDFNIGEHLLRILVDKNEWDIFKCINSDTSRCGFRNRLVAFINANYNIKYSDYVKHDNFKLLDLDYNLKLMIMKMAECEYSQIIEVGDEIDYHNDNKEEMAKKEQNILDEKVRNFDINNFREYPI